ncbi:YopX family protein [Bacillus cytotoxicus]|uniref:YopX family protein n=1 Tax=Bacillus cytotoxicus TaxID=580165 RepID=A0ACC6A5F1_9BACI|nr:YopX family protein [Bacillus cytotoxicus]
MKKIKFRAWDKHKKVMCDVLNINFDAGVVHIKDQKTNLYWGRKFEDVELLQYTGEKDAWDKEIFEGDVVYQEFYDRISEKHGLTGAVKQMEGAWWIDNETDQAERLWSEVNLNHIKGNKFENPELLENQTK